MAAQMVWAGKSLEVSPVKVTPVTGLTADWTVDSETGARGEENYKCTAQLVAGFGVDVRQEIDAWSAMVGSAAPLYIGGRQFGPGDMKLSSLSASITQIDSDGRFLVADLSFSFTNKKYGTTTTPAASVAALVGTNAGALAARPSSSGKQAAKKPSLIAQEVLPW